MSRDQPPEKNRRFSAGRAYAEDMAPEAALLGHWTGREELFPTAWTTGGYADGALTIEPGPGGLILDYSETQDRGTLTAHAVLVGSGFWWFDSYGFVPHAPGTAGWEGHTLVLDRHSPRGRTVMRLRPEGTMLVVELDTAAPADAALAPVMRARYSRVAD
jgi:hypothetical protein